LGEAKNPRILTRMSQKSLNLSFFSSHNFTIFPPITSLEKNKPSKLLSYGK
jgi:hypothetical protein